MRKTAILICFFAWTSGLPDARGQSIGPSTINAAGGGGTIGTRIFDYSIGEMALVSTYTSSSVIITQGVLQNRSATSGVNDPGLSGQMTVFPNPASTIVNLEYNSSKTGTMHYRLMDILGKVIVSRQATVAPGTTKEQIDIANLAAATYMLEVTFKASNGAEQRTSYKIDKLK